MIWLFLSIIFNTLIAVIFKLFGRFNIHLPSVIIINYLVCYLVGALVESSFMISWTMFGDGIIYLCMILGMFFPLTFNLFATSIQKSGIMISTIFQKLSLIAPVLVAVVLWGESVSYLKIFGLLLTIFSIVLIPYSTNKTKTYHFILPFMVFIGSCLIDSGIAIANKFSTLSDLVFVSLIFLFAFIFASIHLLITNFGRWNNTMSKQNLAAGLILGIPNFFSIYFIFFALESGLEVSMFFPVNNLSILVFATLVGIVIFKEEMNSYRILGFCCAFSAIILLSYA